MSSICIDLVRFKIGEMLHHFTSNESHTGVKREICDG